MPSFYQNIEANAMRILESVSKQAVSGILSDIGQREVFEKAIYIENSYTVYSDFSDGEGAPSLNKDRCDVSIKTFLDKSQVPWPNDTLYTTTSLGSRSNLKGQYAPILVDPDAGVIIEQMTVACSLQMDFKLNFQTFEGAVSAFDKIMGKYKGGGSFTVFDLSMSYYLPTLALEYLVAVQTRKAEFANGTILDYVDKYKTTEISLDRRASQLGEEQTDVAVAVQYQQMSAVAQITFDQAEPEPVKEDRLPDSYIVEFSATIQFGRPAYLAIHSPVSVENSVLPQQLFESYNPQIHYNTSLKGLSHMLMVNEYLRRSFGPVNYNVGAVRLPVYDDWNAFGKRYHQHQYKPLIIAHFTLDDAPFTYLDLKFYDDLVLHPVLQEIFKEMGTAILKYGGLFHVGVYAGDMPLDSTLLDVDANLNLKISTLRKDKEYRLVISEATDISQVDFIWNPILLKYRFFFPMTIERNLEKLLSNKTFVIEYDNHMANLISRLQKEGKLKTVLTDLILAEEVSFAILNYTQNPAQLIDFMTYTQSAKANYVLPTEETLPEGIDPSVVPIIEEYYATKASTSSRPLAVAFIEKCLMRKYITLSQIPANFIRPNPVKYPYIPSSGGFYAYNTPLRVLNFNIRG